MPSDAMAAPFAVYGDSGAVVLFSGRERGFAPRIFDDERITVAPTGAAAVLCTLESDPAFADTKDPVAATLVCPGLPPLSASDLVRDRFQAVLRRHLKGPPFCGVADRGATLNAARLRLSGDGLYLRTGEQFLHRPSKEDLKARKLRLDEALAKTRAPGCTLVVFDAGYGNVTPDNYRDLVAALQPSRVVYALAGHGFNDGELFDRVKKIGPQLAARDCLVMAAGTIVRWAGKLHRIHADREGLLFSSRRGQYAAEVATALRTATEASVFAPAPIETLCVTDGVRVVGLQSPCGRPAVQFFGAPAFAARLASYLRLPADHVKSKLRRAGAEDFGADLPAWRGRPWLRWSRNRIPSSVDRSLFRDPVSEDETLLLEASAYATAYTFMAQRSLFLPRIDEHIT